MRFPKCLCQNGRGTIDEDKIHPLNFMYARHKPGVDWMVDNDYPEFSKIKTDQSFNWSAFSIPVWARFNNQKHYYHDYGVMGYSVNTLKNSHLIDSNIPAGLFRIHHDPDPLNYSHCESYQPHQPSTKEKRAWRMVLKHKCQKHILPERKCSWLKIVSDYPIMWYHRLLVKRTL